MARDYAREDRPPANLGGKVKYDVPLAPVLP
jgi:hypothetical protein